MMNSDSSRNLNIKVTLIELSKERRDDVEFPSVCCEYVLLPLISTDADFAKLDRIESGRKSKQGYREKEGRVWELVAAAKGVKYQSITSKPRSMSIEMGRFKL